MLMPTNGVRVLVCAEPTDMRKSFYGLYGITKTVLEEDPLSGALFVFLNRRCDYVKVLYFDRGGLCLWAKKLERGTFEQLRGTNGARKRTLTMSEFLMLVDGVDLSSVRRRLRLNTQNSAV